MFIETRPHICSKCRSMNYEHFYFNGENGIRCRDCKHERMTPNATTGGLPDRLVDEPVIYSIKGDQPWEF
jgi:hypothetical protein